MIEMLGIGIGIAVSVASVLGFISLIAFLSFQEVKGSKEYEFKEIFGNNPRGEKYTLQSVVDFKLTQKAFAIWNLQAKLSSQREQVNELTNKFRDKHQEQDGENRKLSLETINSDTQKIIDEIQKLGKELEKAKDDFKQTIRIAKFFRYKTETSHNLYITPVE